MDYRKAQTLLANARTPSAGKPIANNTRLLAREAGAIAVRLHSTDIITFYPDGRAILNTGGWHTVTTKARMVEFSPAVRISSVRGTWHVTYAGADYLYADGMTLHADGTVTGAGSVEDAKREEAAKKSARKYARHFVNALHAGKVDPPGAGDCWYCCMRDERGATMGEATHDASHIASHIEERYYVPSLLVTALERMGASVAEKQTAMAFMLNQREHAFTLDRASFVFEGIEKRLYRYIAERSGLPAFKGAERGAPMQWGAQS